MVPALLQRLAREPITQFVVIGGALFALGRAVGPQPAIEERPAIVLDAADVARLRQAWAEQYGAAPGPREERRLIDAAIDEEVLHREALALGLDRDDPLVRTRLAQIAGALGEGPVEDEDELLRAARASGLDRTDVVSRRYLVQAVRLLAAAPRAGDLPSEAAVAAFYEQHRDEFAAPHRQHLTQVFLSADRRGASLERDAARLLDRLRRERVEPARAAEHGDPFVRGAEVALDADAALDRAFGPGFAAAVAALPEGAWAGPVRSAYGLHLVWVHDRAAVSAPEPTAVQSRVVLRMLRERREARRQAVVAGLRERYLVRVEGGVPAATLSRR